MRANAAMTRIVRGSLVELMAVPDRQTHVLLHWHKALGDRILGATLPDGRSARQASWGNYAALRSHVASTGRHLSDTGYMLGVDTAVALWAKEGTSKRWWLTPRWTEIVANFVAALGDAEHWHWRGGMTCPTPQRRPGRCGDPAALREALLDGPDRLSAEEAEFCTDCLIGYCIRLAQPEATGPQL